MTRNATSMPRIVCLGREFAALPALASSVLMVIVLAGGTGRWAPAVVVGWVGVGMGLVTQAGERLAVRARGWLRLRDGHVVREAIERVLTLDRVPGRAFDCYVTPAAQPNAFAAGRRSVAVTSGLLDVVAAGQVDRPAFGAVLAHEIGHLVSGATRYRLATWWWSLPWRHTGQRAVALCLRPHRSRRYGATAARAVLGLVVVVVAAGQLAGADQWSAAVLLVVGTVSALVLPSVGAAVNRYCEVLADDIAARQGRSDDLARALTLLTRWSSPTRGRLRADHPAPAQRLRRLDRDTRSVAQ